EKIGMILKALKTNKLLTINYQNNGFVQTVKGYIQNLNLLEQTLLLKDENQHVRSLRLSSIKNIY
ncbi:YolD-like family protein, partial [Priestia megaterium]